MDRKKLSDSGIDYFGAMKYFAGNEEMYNKFLMKFKDDNHMDMARSAFSSKDYDLVLKNVHIMKGMVSTLGMKDLFKACSDVVASIRAGQYDMLEDHMKSVEREYEKVMDIYE